MLHFTMDECTRSATARAKGIDNTPGAMHREHIEESVDNLIDPLRVAWGQYCAANGLGTGGIRVSSGYRGPALNEAVGGSPTSAHCCGYAFDLIPVNGKMMAFKRFCRQWLADKVFDQLISEGEDGNGKPRWMHVGYKSPNGEQRHQYFSMIGGKYYQMTD